MRKTDANGALESLKAAVRSDLGGLGIFLAGFIILLQIVYMKENIGNTIKIALSLLYLFALPGYTLMLAWHDRLGLLERLVIGPVMGLALMGTVGYLLGLVGLHVRIQAIILPIILTLAGLLHSLHAHAPGKGQRKHTDRGESKGKDHENKESKDETEGDA